jgi:cytoskeleton protein RodZ
LAERSVPGGTMLLVAVILAICGYGLWYYLSSSAHPRPERVDAVPAELAPHPTVAAAPQATTEAPAALVSSAPSAAAPATESPVAAASEAPPAAAAAPAAPVAEPPSPTLAMAPAVTPTLMPAPPPPPAPAAALPSTPEAPAAPPPVVEKPRIYGVANGSTRIVLRAANDSWVQIRDANNVSVFARELHAGDSYRVPDRPGLLLHTGVPNAITATVDGHAAPNFRGGVKVNILLEPDRLVAGTAMVSSSATPAPSATPTLPAPSAPIDVPPTSPEEPE